MEEVTCQVYALPDGSYKWYAHGIRKEVKEFQCLPYSLQKAVAVLNMVGERHKILGLGEWASSESGTRVYHIVSFKAARDL